MFTVCNFDYPYDLRRHKATKNHKLWHNMREKSSSMQTARTVHARARINGSRWGWDTKRRFVNVGSHHKNVIDASTIINGQKTTVRRKILGRTFKRVKLDRKKVKMTKLDWRRVKLMKLDGRRVKMIKLDVKRVR